MKRLIITILFILAPVLIQAQSISMAPSSVKAWGTTLNTVSASLEYKEAGLHVFKVGEQIHPPTGEMAGGYYYGISYKPITYKYGKLGLIAFDKPFPFPSSTRINFWVEAKLPLGDHIEFSYIHISNGYTGQINVGLDLISIKYKL